MVSRGLKTVNGLEYTLTPLIYIYMVRSRSTLPHGYEDTRVLNIDKFIIWKWVCLYLTLQQRSAPYIDGAGGYELKCQFFIYHAIYSFYRQIPFRMFSRHSLMIYRLLSCRQM